MVKVCPLEQTNKILLRRNYVAEMEIFFLASSVCLSFIFYLVEEKRQGEVGLK